MFKDKIKNSEGFWEVTPQSVLENKDKVKIIDVRRPEEYTGELGHIESAELVTLETQFQKAVQTWDRGESIIFVCKSGGRSGRATAYAQSLGFKEVYNMEGGMMLWNELGLPTE